MLGQDRQRGAVLQGRIQGKITPEYQYDINGNPCGEIEGSLVAKDSIVNVESLRSWLDVRGIRSGFFFPAPIDSADYLEKKNPRYAPKLAMAVRAWQAVTDAGKKTPKQALEKWIREHAAEYGLVDDEGIPVVAAVEECSKVANWNPSGGAPKTPNYQSTP